ncbi:hypothetical protein ACFFU9_12270 [Mariniflexile ostreae]|uniref:Uncharacterized protein n=1 Tax=Mariniflexile ostreae TaxID=1520892 RepID=A0ABV5FDM5_9FLAO
MKKKSIMFLVVFVIIVTFSTIYFSIRINNLEKKMEIDFKVERVEITPAFRVVLYDKSGNKLRLQRFVFFERHGILPNDIVIKEAGSETLNVYRIDSLGNNVIHLKMNMD